MYEKFLARIFSEKDMEISMSDLINRNAVAYVKKGEARFFKAGSAWIYDNEIGRVEGTYENGDIITVRDFDDYFLGYGYINENSKIRLRMMSRKEDTVIDELFIKKRVKAAWDYRKCVLEKKDLSSCRVIFGEADFLPGITVDKYEDILVAQCLSLGIDRIKDIVISQLLEVLKEDGVVINGVYERSDAKERKKEGLPVHKGFMGKECHTDIEITENDVKYLVDVVDGQKTGFFLDQKYNRLAMQRISRGILNTALEDGLLTGKREKVKVLDCFTHMGTFALNCGYAMQKVLIDNGVSSPQDYMTVTGLDISEYAVEQATNNSKRNGLEKSVGFRAANVLDELPRLYEQGESYDLLILDPPAFTKSKEATKNAIKGYREINMKGLKLVKDGGYFATCSCSHFMTEELFKEVITQAAKAVHKRIRQVEFRTQSPDHPILWAAGESYYLKFLIFQVVDEK